jgi:hypothetical protein
MAFFKSQVIKFLMLVLSRKNIQAGPVELRSGMKDKTWKPDALLGKPNTVYITAQQIATVKWRFFLAVGNGVVVSGDKIII